MIQKFKNYYHLGAATFANLIYGLPARKLTVIGVTGTDGKTTTSSLIYHILKESGQSVSLISTVGAKIAGKDYDIGFHVTTPSSLKLQEYIKKVAQSQSKYLVLEVTSHALDQYRTFGIPFDIGVITNVTHEHLDYHKTYENYVRVKSRLLKMARLAIINRDDNSYPLLSKILINKKKLLTYGSTPDADINFSNFTFETQLLGMFNRYNILAAAAVCKSLDISDIEIQSAIKTFQAPIGRQEVVYKGDFVVMVDFAHTPNSFTSLLPDIKTSIPGRLIHVFGSASKRDATKRPLMGEASARSSDVIILTAEDPRGESVEKINHEIELGIANYEALEKEKLLVKIPDRREAINYAVSIAKKGDCILITGKGPEKSMNMGNGEEPWDEIAVVKEALKKNNHE